MKRNFLKILLILAICAPMGLTPILSCACDRAVQHHDCCDEARSHDMPTQAKGTSEPCCTYNKQFPIKQSESVDGVPLRYERIVSLAPNWISKPLISTLSGPTLACSDDEHHPPPDDTYLKNQSLLL